MKSPPTNVAHSVRMRLLTLSKQDGEEFNYTLTRYAIERLLARIASSTHAKSFILKGAMLFRVRAIAATFARRKTALPIALPVALTSEFADDDSKQKQWAAFVKRVAPSAEPLHDVIAVLAPFLGPPLLQAAAPEKFRMEWSPAGPWVPAGGV